MGLVMPPGYCETSAREAAAALGQRSFVPTPPPVAACPCEGHSRTDLLKLRTALETSQVERLRVEKELRELKATTK